MLTSWSRRVQNYVSEHTAEEGTPPFNFSVEKATQFCRTPALCDVTKSTDTITRFATAGVWQGTPFLSPFTHAQGTAEVSAEKS